MGKIALTWEGGNFLGHEMLVTSAALLARSGGHEVVVYAPEGHGPNGAALAQGLRWENLPAAPEAGPPAPTGVAWHSRATTLWNFGFHSSETLQDRFRAWDVVFQKEQPDLLLLQAAPYAQVAAHLLHIPSVEFGVSFDVPPAMAPFPAFRNTEAFDPLEAVRFEERVMQRLARAFPSTRLGKTLHSMVSGRTRLVTAVPEIDNYEGCGDASRQFIGPLPVVDRGGPRPGWGKRKAGRPRVLAYVRADLMDAAGLVKALARLRCDAVVVCPGADDEALRLAKDAGLRLHTAPVSLADLMPQADVVVSHGGGIVAESLMHGCACVVLPTQYEQFMTAQALQRGRLGVMVNPRESDAVHGRAIGHVLQHPEIRQNVRQLQARHAALADPGRPQFMDALRRALLAS
jgi:UDP:flavonoid glycosyltransferase YjiC (YdhE family)